MPARKKKLKAQVTGIGGIFFKARNPERMAAWYGDNLGIHTKDGYTDFAWREKDRPKRIGRTVWSLFPANTKYFKPSKSSFMLNYRVANLDLILKKLRRKRIKIEKVENYDYGKFAWIMDPEGNRIELWEPKGE